MIAGRGDVVFKSDVVNPAIAPLNVVYQHVLADMIGVDDLRRAIRKRRLGPQLPIVIAVGKPALRVGYGVSLTAAVSLRLSDSSADRIVLIRLRRHRGDLSITRSFRVS